ncbi:MAG: sugar transferase, partial [Actinomycetota bacterium]|nr:sugar transferase [Actinomycetota bacterium]
MTHEATEAQETDDGPTLVRRPLPERDVRAKRPALLGFVLKLDTLRRLARVVSLLVLDFAGLFAAIYSALALKAVLLDAWDPAASLQETQNTISFAYLITALLFARSGLYAERATRPGLTRIVGSLFQTTVVTLIFALINGETFSSYYIFYGTLFFAVLYVASARWGYEKLTGIVLRAAGYQRRAVLVGTGKHIEAVAHALLDAPDHEGIEVVGFISLSPRPDNGLRSLGTLDEIERVLAEHRLDEVIIADP